jgi:hypothetical protein
MRGGNFYKTIDNLKKTFQPRSNGCRNKDGEIIKEDGENTTMMGRIF